MDVPGLGVKDTGLHFHGEFESASDGPAMLIECRRFGAGIEIIFNEFLDQKFGTRREISL